MDATRKLITELYSIVRKLEELHPHRNFTPDGILVGSIGEVLAEYHYGLSPLPPGTPKHDCSRDGLLIQVKTTQGASIQIGEPCDHLLALKLSKAGTIEEFYNGPGGPVWDLVKGKPLPKNGLYAIRLPKLRKMMTDVAQEDQIARARD